MNRRQVFPALLIVLVCAVLIAQIAIAPVPAQMSQPKITGKVVDKVVKRFDAAGLPGIHSIEYRRFTMSPGAKVEGEFVFDGYAVLSVARSGKITVTFPDGSKATFKGEDVFTIPSGAKTKLFVADAKLGWDEFYWSINLKKRK
jgi:hypothetical protein